MDRAIQKTDDDALLSKAAAARKGYFKDDLLPLFLTKQPPARLPLINIGTYCRVIGVNKLVNEFLETTSGSPRAIVSLGAGSDTRPFWLLRAHEQLAYYELDFPAKTEAKQRIIARNPQLAEVAANRDYHLLGIDLRSIEQLALKLEKLKGLPILLLSECCLCYLKPAEANNVIEFFAKLAPPKQLFVVLYEPMSLHDEFGRVMAENLAMRGISMPTAEEYPSLQSQIARIESLTGMSAKAVSILKVWQEWVSGKERERLAHLEFLDEVEEMHLLMRHYCLVWSISGE